MRARSPLDVSEKIDAMFEAGASMLAVPAPTPSSAAIASMSPPTPGGFRSPEHRATDPGRCRSIGMDVEGRDVRGQSGRLAQLSPEVTCPAYALPFSQRHRMLRCRFGADPDGRAAGRLQGDYQKYCKGTIPGGGRIIACLNKQRDQLAEGCKKVLDA